LPLATAEVVFSVPAAANWRLVADPPGLWANTNWLVQASSKVCKSTFIFLKITNGLGKVFRADNLKKAFRTIQT
jgi:hypothetical protein